MWDWYSPTRYGNQRDSVPRDGIGEIIKVNFYDLFQSLDRCETVSFTGQVQDQTNQSNLWLTHRLEGRPDSKDEEEKGEAEPPLGNLHLPNTSLARPPPQDCPQALPPSPPPGARQPRRTHRPFGRRTLSFLLGARRARSGCG